MKVSRCSAEQMIHLWQQAERGEPSIGARCREHGITAPTCDRWRTKCGGMTVPAAQRVCEWAQEKARLTRLRAERDLAVDALKALLGKPSSR
jgi:putative transposase